MPLQGFYAIVKKVVFLTYFLLTIDPFITKIITTAASHVFNVYAIEVPNNTLTAQIAIYGIAMAQHTQNITANENTIKLFIRFLFS